MMCIIINNDIAHNMEEQNLSELALRLTTIIDTAIDGIIIIDSNGCIEQINQSAAILFQYEQEEVVGKNVKILMPEPYKSAHDGYIKRYQRTKEPHIVGIGREVVGKKNGGETFPFRLAVSEVVLNDRVIYTGIVHDLTDIRLAEEKLLRINEHLEEKVEERTNELEDAVNQLLRTNKKLKENEGQLSHALQKEKELSVLKSRFVSMASHEFRTPLSTIMSSASLIAKYPLEEQKEKREKHITRIKSAVSNLTGILNDFLSLSKLEEGKIQAATSELDILSLIDNTIDELKVIMKPGQTIVKNASTPQIIINSDARILKNILFNLLSNGVKYSDKEISCSVSKKTNTIEIQITDEGVGIPEKEQKYLFERFFRASNVENIQGTGLGLNIVKNYLDMLNGKIRFESKENKGTTFYVTIPIDHEKNSSN